MNRERPKEKGCPIWWQSFFMKKRNFLFFENTEIINNEKIRKKEQIRVNKSKLDNLSKK